MASMTHCTCITSCNTNKYQISMHIHVYVIVFYLNGVELVSCCCQSLVKNEIHSRDGIYMPVHVLPSFEEPAC